MVLADRDRQIVQLIARFKQAGSRQVHDLLYYNLASYTPCNRALRRLTDQGYLARIERRIAGGARGGSGQYVYQLGRRGFYQYFEGSFQPSRAVNYHCLAIVDSFVAFRQLERQGVFRIEAVSTEPDCWARVGATELKPDLYIELERDGKRLKRWLEVDMGTESQKQLLAKLTAYIRAYGDADAAHWPEFPAVLWVGVDAERVKELRWLIGRLNQDEAPELFSVCLLTDIPLLFR